MTERRSFLKSLSVFLGGTIAVPAVLEAQATTEPWLTFAQKGKHRFFMDVDQLLDGHPLVRAGNYLDCYKEDYKVDESAINALFGMHGTAIAFAMTDGMWEKYKLGERNSINDPKTGKPATRNVYLTTGTPGVRDNAIVPALMKRGVRFLACQNAITSLAAKLAADGHGTAPEIIKTIDAGLVPGTLIVPAMAVAANRAQEAGFSYAYVR